VAYTWDGTSSRLYVDGILAAVNSVSPAQTGSNLGIGKNNGDTGWEGMIDNVAVFNDARAAAEVASDVGGVPTNDPNLLAYFTFEEGVGQTTVNQKAGGGPNGVLGFNTNVEVNDPEWTMLMLLPVELTQFEASLRGGHSMLAWATASEQSNKGFFVEKSGDGTHFTSIGFVAGAGDSQTENHYHFTDKHLAAAAYYRLRQVDFDGGETLSPVRYVEPEGGSAGWLIYPNPITPDAVFELHAPSGQAAEVEFTDAWGRCVARMGLDLAEGRNNLQVATHGWPSGWYTAIARGSGGLAAYARFQKPGQ
jgi:hypothetical protein